MNSFVINQLQVFLIFIIIGIFIALLFDFFRILRKCFKTPDYLTYIEDIIFWITTCIVLAISIFKYNNGEIRAFLFIGLFIGILFYIFVFSNYVIKICTNIIKYIRKIISKALYYLSFPLKIIFSFIRKIIFKPITILCIKANKYIQNKNIILQILLKISNKLYKNLPKKVK